MPFFKSKVTPAQQKVGQTRKVKGKENVDETSKMEATKMFVSYIFFFEHRACSTILIQLFLKDKRIRKKTQLNFLSIRAQNSAKV